MTIPAGPARRIRVLLVDDSPLAIELICRMLAGSSEIEVAGSALNGAQALELIPGLRPDVIVTDLHMPGMGGLELTREVMRRHPLPVLVMSQSAQPAQSANIFQMLEAGALDVVAKPRGGLESNFDATAQDLRRKIRVAAGVVVMRRRASGDSGGAAPPVSVSASAVPSIIGIGASTGGPQAFQAVLRGLPADFARPLICVQHIATDFMQGLVDWLADQCRIRVQTAVEGSAPLAGHAYFAPDGRHLAIDAAGRFQCAAAHLNVAHRPSIDVAFGSLARYYGHGALGVVLTGMGEDGAQGLLAIARAGGYTIAQDEGSSIVFGMPRRAVDVGAARHVLALDQIAPALISIVAGKKQEGT
jgi:two-component system chemotaxis response regulator CheB